MICIICTESYVFIKMKIFLNRISVTEKNSWDLGNIKKAFRNHREISLPKEKKAIFRYYAICRLAEHFFQQIFNEI